MRRLALLFALLNVGCMHRPPAHTFVLAIQPPDKGDFHGTYEITSGRQARTTEFHSTDSAKRPMRIRLRGRGLSFSLKNDATEPLVFEIVVDGRPQLRKQIEAGEAWGSMWQ